MAKLTAPNFRLRKDFSQIKKIVDIPNLIELQQDSFKKFIQYEGEVETREDTGLQSI